MINLNFLQCYINFQKGSRMLKFLKRYIELLADAFDTTTILTLLVCQTIIPVLLVAAVLNNIQLNSSVQFIFTIVYFMLFVATAITLCINKLLNKVSWSLKKQLLLYAVYSAVLSFAFLLK